MTYNLEVEMLKHKVPTKEIAKAINKDETSVRNKLRGKTPFAFKETLAIRDSFFPDKSLEYLFGETEKEAG